MAFRRTPRRGLALALPLVLWVWLSLAGAPRAARAAAEDEARTRARALFTEGAALAHRAQWAEALASFEASMALVAHPVTTYNVGACERALGRYTRARRAFHLALGARDDAGAGLAPAIAEEARAFLAEIERLLVRAEVTISPAGAALAVDGRPVEPDDVEEESLVAGTAPPGPGAATPARFTLLLGPGSHLFTLSRRGYSDIALNRTLGPGERATLPLELSRLPARLRVASNQEAAAVALDGVDVGATPLTLERPAGSYTLLVRKQGFAPYQVQFHVAAGEELDLSAPLAPERRSILRRWWFWSAIGVVVAGAAAGTYFATRRPDPPDCGGLGVCFGAP